MFKIVLKSTFQSVILFFAVSFITILYDILPKWMSLPKKIDYNIYEITIGFPFQYYERFWLDIDGPNHGWNLNNLIYDCLIFWLITFSFYFLKDKKAKSRENIK